MNEPHETWELPHRHIGRRVLCYREVGSTNDLAAEMDEPGLAVLADQQSQGRGQYGRTWVAALGSSVLLSARLTPPPELRRPVVLTAWAAVAVAETITQMIGQTPRIKWPNDVLLNDRKVCGVLIEQRRATIAGIGLNLNQSAEEFAAAGLPLASSLAAMTGRTFAVADVAKLLLAELDRQYDRLLLGDLASLEKRWQQQLALLGREVIAECFDATRYRGRLMECKFAGVQLQCADQSIRLVPEQVRALSLIE